LLERARRLDCIVDLEVDLLSALERIPFLARPVSAGDVILLLPAPTTLDRDVPHWNLNALPDS
jgi:hypothetical protein